MFKIDISLDDRARLVTAVLAASHWPELEQQQTPHAVHPHSKRTGYHVESAKTHTAVTQLNQGLANGISLSDYFAAALRCSWPNFAPQEDSACRPGRWCLGWHIGRLLPDKPTSANSTKTTANPGKQPTTTSSASSKQAKLPAFLQTAVRRWLVQYGHRSRLSSIRY